MTALPARPTAAVVGLLNVAKGQDLALEALARHPALQLLLVGYGETEPELRAMAARLGVEERVAFAGFRLDVPALLAAADLLLLPSRWEGMPYIVLEAMASGLPSVSTPVVGVGEILGDEEGGLLVPQRDPDAVAAAIATILDDPARRDRLAVDCRSRAERLFAVERNVAVLRSAFAAGAPRHGDAR